MSKVFVLNKNVDTENNGIFYQCMGVYTELTTAQKNMRKDYNGTIVDISNDGDYDAIDFETTQISDRDAVIRVDVNSGDIFSWQIEEMEIQ